MNTSTKNLLLVLIAMLTLSIVPAVTHAQCVDEESGAPIACGSSPTSEPATAAPSNTAVTNTPANTAPVNTSANAGITNTPSNTGIMNTPSNTAVINNPTQPTSGGFFYIQNPLSSQFNTVGGIVSGFLAIVAYLAVLAGVLAIIWIGFQFVLARGNSDRMNELKDQLIWVVVGIAVVIGARILVTVVINTLQATGTVNSNVIQNAHNALNGN